VAIVNAKQLTKAQGWVLVGGFAFLCLCLGLKVIL
jgi:hypothetical protein